MSLIAFTKKTSNSATDIEAVRQTGQGNVLHFSGIWTPRRHSVWNPPLHCHDPFAYVNPNCYTPKETKSNG